MEFSGDPGIAIRPDGTLEIQNSQNQLYKWRPSETISVMDAFGNILELNRDIACTSSITVDPLCSDETSVNVIFSEGQSDEKFHGQYIPDNCVASSNRPEDTTIVKIPSSPELSQDDTQAGLQPMIFELEVSDRAEQIIEANSSTEVQLKCSYNVEIPDKRLSNDTPIQRKSRALEGPRKRAKRKFVPNDEKDDEYWAKRAKNNAAARRSRAVAKEKKKKLRLESTTMANADLKSRYMALLIEQEKLKCDAMLLRLDLAKM